MLDKINDEAVISWGVWAQKINNNIRQVNDCCDTDLAEINNGDTVRVWRTKINALIDHTQHYYDNTVMLSISRVQHLSAKVGKHTLFGGGITHDHRNADAGTWLSQTVDVFGPTLQRLLAPPFPRIIDTCNGAAAYTDRHAFFMGAGDVIENGLVVYDETLQLTMINNVMPGIRNMGAARAGRYVLFAGGSTGAASFNAVVFAIDETLQITKPPNLSDPRVDLVGASAGNQALFAGGSGNVVQIAPGAWTHERDTVEVYTDSLQKINAPALSARGIPVGTSAGDYTLYGFHARGSPSGLIALGFLDAYSPTLQKTNPAQIVNPGLSGMIACNFNDHAVFANGSWMGRTANTNVYDGTLQHRLLAPINTRVSQRQAESVGDYMLISGGYAIQTGMPSRAVSILDNTFNQIQ
jgi:hypothetical protein